MVGVVVQPLAECGDFYGPNTPAGAGLLTVVSLDLDDPRAQQTDVSVFGDKGLVYASTEALYLTTSRDYVFEAWEAGLWEEETSGIHKFDIESDPSEALYRATGTAPGRMLNQFCLGEHEGFLRVATTTGEQWDPSTLDNHLLVYEEQNGALDHRRIDAVARRGVGAGAVVDHRQVGPRGLEGRIGDFDIRARVDQLVVAQGQDGLVHDHQGHFGARYRPAGGVKHGDVNRRLAARFQLILLRRHIYR